MGGLHLLSFESEDGDEQRGHTAAGAGVAADLRGLGAEVGPRVHQSHFLPCLGSTAVDAW